MLLENDTAGGAFHRAGRQPSAARG